ncbi:hypothetical protein NQZ68_017909 [Dissostichus eleginoides]|nr:hypothetical protein NQZ68_017909 [Dissostichus eleginoides]
MSQQTFYGSAHASQHKLEKHSETANRWKPPQAMVHQPRQHYQRDRCPKSHVPATDTDPSNDPLLGNNYIGPLWRPRVAPYLQIYGRSLVKTLHHRGNSHHLLHVSNHP